jgi:hypothetical protein
MSVGRLFIRRSFSVLYNIAHAPGVGATHARGHIDQHGPCREEGISTAVSASFSLTVFRRIGHGVTLALLCPKRFTIRNYLASTTVPSSRYSEE